MENITIKKATLSSGLGLKVVFSQREKDGSYSDISKDCSAPVHDDLQFTFSKFAVHLGLISEFIKSEEISNIDQPQHELLDSFNVKEFEIEGDNAGVKLGGTRKLSTNKRLAIKTPAVKWNDKKPYEHSGPLAEIVERAKKEVVDYLFNGKHAPEPQMDMDFTGGDPEEAN